MSGAQGEMGVLLGAARTSSNVETLAEGALLLRGFVAAEAASIFEIVRQIAVAAPFRHMVTPGGYRMSVAMTNCGEVGWTTNRSGYRYARFDPETNLPWPPMPPTFLELARRAACRAGFADFDPDSCLINRYEPGAKLSLHQDKNEKRFDAPIVSFSLGLPATFLFGGLTRSERPRRVRLESGDVAVWGGPARLAYHGIDPLGEGVDPLTGGCRLNLTFRSALVG